MSRSFFKRHVVRWTGVIILLVLVILFCVYFPQIKAAYYSVSGGGSTWDSKYSLWKYVLQHMKIVSISSAFVIVIGIGLGLLSTSEKGLGVKGLLDKLIYLGQMIPSLAMLTFLVPMLGMGAKPAIIALVIIGILPVYTGVVTGIENVPRDVIEVAQGIGMKRKEILTSIILPLALPVIVSGLRISLVINISAATLAARIGAGGLGILILDSMRTGKIISIIEGTVPICLIAMIVDRTLKNVEDMVSARFQKIR